MRTSLLSAAHWAAVLRIGLGLWWLESFRHKNLEAWIKRQAGIKWAADIAEKHKFKMVGSGFNAVVKPHPKAMTWVVLMSELALGLGITARLSHPGGALRQHRLEPSVLRAHDPRLGRAGSERHDDPRRGGDPGPPRLADMVDRPPDPYFLRLPPTPAASASAFRSGSFDVGPAPRSSA